MHALSNRIKPSGENAFIAFLTGDQEVVQILTLIVINAKTFSQDKSHKTLNITALMLICACSLHTDMKYKFHENCNRL